MPSCRAETENKVELLRLWLFAYMLTETLSIEVKMCVSGILHAPQLQKENNESL